MNISQFAFKQDRLIYFFLFALVLGGIGSYTIMSKLEDPEVKVKSALIITLYPGASAEDVEQAVTDNIETVLQSLEAVDVVKSRSIPNMSQIEVQLQTNVQNEEIKQHWDELRKKVADVQSKLPDGVMPSIVYDDFGDVYGLFYAMTADGYSWEQMSDYAKDLKTQLLAIDGVSRVNINGEQSLVIDINISEEKVSALGIHPIKILTSLRNQLDHIYAGYYQTTGKRIRISVDDDFKTVEQIENMVLQYGDKAQIKLKDIAEVQRTYVDPPSDKMKFNNQNALGISVSMASGQNIVEIGKKVEACIAQMKTRLPVGFEFHKVYFQSEEVDAALSNFLINLLESVIIVILIIMVVMGFRSGVIIGSSLLLTIVGTFPFLLFAGGTIQRVSLASFIVAMGMLVDNAIVVIDGIYEDLKNKMDRHEAMLDAPRRTAWPLLGATLIAIASFLPVYLSPDSTGTYTRDLFLVLCFSLGLSWLLAMFQVPLSANRLLKLSAKDANGDTQEHKSTRIIRATLTWTLKYRKITIGCTIAALVLAFIGFKFVKKEFFPVLPHKQAYMEFKMPDGTSIDKVESDLDAITDWLLAKPEVESVTTGIGKTPTRYNLLRLIAEQNPAYGELIITFKEKKFLNQQKAGIEAYVRQHYPDAFVRIKSYMLIFTDGLVEVEVSGDDISVLKKLASQVEEIMTGAPNVNQPTIRTNWEEKAPYLCVNYNQFDANLAEISRDDLGFSLLSATDGLPVARFFQGYKELPVKLKITDNGWGPLEKLNNIPIWGLNSIQLPIKDILKGDVPLDQIEEQLLRPSPLSSVANISLQWEEPVIRRVNGIRTIKVQCDPIGDYTASEVVKTIRKQVESISLPAGYAMTWKGEMGDQEKALRYIVMYLPVSVVVIVVLLLSLYKSYRKMLVTFFSLLLAFIGIVPAVLLTGVGFGFVAIVGVIGLMGMMIKNAVVLIDEIDRQIANGRPVNEAVIQASILRVRPVMMASLTTILGMLPLVKDAFFGSLAVTIMGGLLVGTLITLIILPLLYSIFFKKQKIRLF